MNEESMEEFMEDEDVVDPVVTRLLTGLAPSTEDSPATRAYVCIRSLEEVEEDDQFTVFCTVFGNLPDVLGDESYWTASQEDLSMMMEWEEEWLPLGANVIDQQMTIRSIYYFVQSLVKAFEEGETEENVLLKLWEGLQLATTYEVAALTFSRVIYYSPLPAMMALSVRKELTLSSDEAERLVHKQGEPFVKFLSTLPGISPELRISLLAAELKGIPLQDALLLLFYDFHDEFTEFIDE